MLNKNNIPEQPNLPLATIFIERQPYGTLYTLNEALCNGTLFANLNRPYVKKMR